MKTAIFGAGSWGTALAKHLGIKGHEVTLLTKTRDHANAINNDRRNSKFVNLDCNDINKFYTLPRTVKAELDSTYVKDKTRSDPDLLIIAVPVDAIAEVGVHLKHFDTVPIMIASKGITQNGRLINECLSEDFHIDPSRIGCISGPNLAYEIMEDEPFRSVISFSDSKHIDHFRREFRSSSAFISGATDVSGTLLCGAMKNVYAIAGGICVGLNHKWNVRAILFDQALHEMSKLLLASGASIDTLNGPAGRGDLFATSGSHESRNFQLGLRIGLGYSPQEAASDLRGNPEGKATSAGIQTYLVRKGLSVDTLPIAQSVHHVLTGHCSAAEAYEKLLELAAVWSAENEATSS